MKFVHAIFLNQLFFQNAWAEFKFRLQIRIQRKISRRIVRVHTGVIVIIPVIRMKKITAWALNFNFSENHHKTNTDSILQRTIRREILR